MATAAFANASSVNARSAAINSFELFLKANCTTLPAVKELIANDGSGNALHHTLDRYSLHLVTAESARGKMLARNTVLQYLSQVKNWFLDQHPELSTVIARRMPAVLSCLENHFKATTGSSTVRQAPACTKDDLVALSQVVFGTADSEVDFHDGALVVVMWHLLGRSSDMTQLTKRNVLIHPGGALSVRFGRVKTGVAQGLALYCDMSVATCPIHAIAIMTAMDRVPAENVFRQLPKWANEQAPDSQDDAPLLSLLQGHIDQVAVASGRVRGAPGVHT